MTIKLGEAITKLGLKKSKVAEHLFPSHKHPMMALNRIISGEGKLASDQISKLALLGGVNIEELYLGKWSCNRRGNTLTLVNNEYEAIIDMQTFTTRLFHNKSLFHETVIHSSTATMREFIDTLNNLIIKNIENVRK